jgi:hypothetical protein
MHKTPDGGAAVFPCLRAGTLFLRRIGRQTEKKDYIKLDGNLQKQDIVRFHLNEDFDACKYCNFLDDKKEQVLPAMQKETARTGTVENGGKKGGGGAYGAGGDTVGH